MKIGETMTLDLYLLRHGESQSNLGGLIGGRSNETPLSERGREQARKLGRRLFEEGIVFDEVYASTAKRAVETARIALNQIYKPAKEVVLIEDLLELSQGDWEGRPRKETYTPEVFRRMNEDPWNYKAPGGESQKEVEERAYSWIEKNLLGRDGDLRVAIFGHGMVTKCLIRRLLDSNPRNTYKISIENASITQFVYGREGWALKRISDHQHVVSVGFKPNREY